MEEAPNPNLIYDLYTGVFRSQIVRLALQMDVFTPLADRRALRLGCDFAGREWRGRGCAEI